MSAFRNRGLNVVVDTIKQAEFDFAKLKLTERQQEIIANTLRALPNSKDDRYVGDMRVREIAGYDIAFVIVRDNDEIAIIIVGVERAQELETPLQLVVRSGLLMLPESIQSIFSGRQKKPEK